MSFLSSSTLLQNLTLGPPVANGDQSAGQKSLRSKSSIANLIQFVREPIDTVGEAVENWYEGNTKEERIQQQILEDKKQILYLRLRNATSYAEWTASATSLDEIEGNNDWKSVFDSPDYDAELVEARLKQLDNARVSCDVERMLFLVRTSLTRGLGDMGNIELYKHAHIGTKDLIERYITSALDTLKALLDVSAKAKCDGLETKYILEQVLSTRQAFGRSALLLSGGATFGMNHIGVLKSLWEARLLPRIISGSSAGSIVCAVFCTRTDEEMPDLLANFCYGDLAVFDEEGNADGLLRKVARFLKIGALFDISHLTRVVRDLLGEMTFQEAYNRTRKILNICVSSASLYELPRLLNYITAPNVLIWSAVAASCSVPFVFSAASILAKDPKTGQAVPWNPSPQRWIDGSVDNDLPMTRLAELFNVNHFIVSQVNPHVVPFLVKEEDSIMQGEERSPGAMTAGPTWLHGITHLAKGEALHRMHTMAELGIFPNTLTKAVSVLSQKYSGDITILPEISYADFPRMLSNPSTEFMLNAQLSGERATWPKLSRIKNHCAIELALDNAVQQLRARVVFSPSQVDLRLGTHTRSNSEIHKSSRGKDRIKKRPLSQAHAAGFQPSAYLHPTRDSTLNRLKPPNLKKSLSISAVLHKPDYTLGSTDATEIPANIVTAPADFSRPPPELTSSGAETSNLPTSSSSSSLSFSSLNDSPSPSSPPSPLSHHHHLFPSASQPTTPSHRYHHSPNFPEPSTKIPSTPTGPSFPTDLSMTRTPPTTTPKSFSSESRYKRLFHHNRSPAAHISSEPGEGSRGRGMKRNWGLDIDISAARGMILRKKKGPQ
ncbi:hypothetical protein MMC07_002923 [Pseudocyphellaria aurata]|nr:hypothetical protein [Pseudocyphellaria aurata]